eukprot:1159305-Pelagomonas_calceolata.AAC.5
MEQHKMTLIHNNGRRGSSATQQHTHGRHSQNQHQSHQYKSAVTHKNGRRGSSATQQRAHGRHVFQFATPQQHTCCKHTGPGAAMEPEAGNLEQTNGDKVLCIKMQASYLRSVRRPGAAIEPEVGNPGAHVYLRMCVCVPVCTHVREFEWKSVAALMNTERTIDCSQVAAKLTACSQQTQLHKPEQQVASKASKAATHSRGQREAACRGQGQGPCAAGYPEYGAKPGCCPNQAPDLQLRVGVVKERHDLYNGGSAYT